MEISEHAKRAASRMPFPYMKRSDEHAVADLVQREAIDPAVREYREALKAATDALGEGADLLATMGRGFGKTNTPSYIAARKLLGD